MDIQLTCSMSPAIVREMIELSIVSEIDMLVVAENQSPDGQIYYILSTRLALYTQVHGVAS